MQFQLSKKHLNIASQHWHENAGAPSRWTRFQNWRGNQSGYFKTRGALDKAHKATTSADTLKFIREAHQRSQEWTDGHKDHHQNEQRANAMQLLRGHLRAAEREQTSHLERKRIQVLTEQSAKESGFHAGNLSAEGMTTLASGQMGTTYNAHFNHQVDAHGAPKPWVYKPDTPLPDGSLMRAPAGGHLINTARGEHEGTDLTLANRSVASSVLDRGMNINALVETHLATAKTADGRLEHGQVMAKASGQTPTRDASWFRHKDGNSWHKEDQGGRKSIRHMWNDIDYSNPKIQRSMMDLQASDFVTNAGNDRHPENYLVDKKTGNVKGIDNDLSMGRHSTKTATQYAHLPPLVHADTAQKILATNFGELSGKLKGLVSDEEVEAAGERLERMQAHIGGLQVKDAALKEQGKPPRHIVQSFGKQTFDDLLSHEGYKEEGGAARTNYVKRHHGKQQKAFEDIKGLQARHKQKMAGTRGAIASGAGRDLLEPGEDTA